MWWCVASIGRCTYVPTVHVCVAHTHCAQMKESEGSWQGRAQAAKVDSGGKLCGNERHLLEWYCSRGRKRRKESPGGKREEEEEEAGKVGTGTVTPKEGRKEGRGEILNMYSLLHTM